jgi:hypothetical protein
LTVAVEASDDDGTPLTYAITQEPASGTLSGTLPNVVYTPNANFNGKDSFSFKANDGTADSNTATIKITVSPVNDAPVAGGQELSTNEDTTLAVAVTASDVDGNALTYTVTQEPVNGTLSGTLPNVVYTPNANFNGKDSFSFKANDDTADSNTAVVNITVSPVNDAPTAVADTATTAMNTGVTIPVTANDSDPDGDTLSITSVTQPPTGSVTLRGGNVTYKPERSFVGSETFSYTVSDGNGGTATTTVTVTVTKEAKGKPTK